MLGSPGGWPILAGEYLQSDLHTGKTNIRDGIINVDAGNYYIDTQKTFTRPVDVSVMIRIKITGLMIKQRFDSGGGGAMEHYEGEAPESFPDCGLVSVFPQKTDRHSGYNAGIHW